MLQDIAPHQFNNEFNLKSPEEDDYILIFNADELLFYNDGSELKFPKFSQLKDIVGDLREKAVYLFSVDGFSFFGLNLVVELPVGFEYKSVQKLRAELPPLTVYIAATAGHLLQWYGENIYCGRCSSVFSHSKKERALCCLNCGLIKYPTISPAIIVGIIDVKNDKLLMTRYSDREYKKLALVAGFSEIGETLEGTVRREVMEEVGLKVKNIRYFDSQPWAFSKSLLVGFFADLDGCSEVKIDSNELSEAKWYSKNEILLSETTLSLTNEMIDAFRSDRVPTY